MSKGAGIALDAEEEWRHHEVYRPDVFYYSMLLVIPRLKACESGCVPQARNSGLQKFLNNRGMESISSAQDIEVASGLCPECTIQWVFGSTPRSLGLHGWALSQLSSRLSMFFLPCSKVNYIIMLLRCIFPIAADPFLCQVIRVCTAEPLPRLVGKLGFSAVVDAAGWTGHTVKMDLLRVLSMILVLWLFSSVQHALVQSEKVLVMLACG